MKPTVTDEQAARVVRAFRMGAPRRDAQTDIRTRYAPSTRHFGVSSVTANQRTGR